MQTPVLVLNTNTKREQGRKAQLGNIQAAQAVADIIRTTLGPRSMLKMILDPMGGLVMTNDGNAILREIDVSHPAAKSMIELSRTQDEEVGDGTTSVIVLAGEMLTVAKPFLEENMHPRTIVMSYIKALDTAIETMDKIAIKVDAEDDTVMLNVIRTCLGTKFVRRFGDLICNIALQAVRKVTITEMKQKVIDIKRFVRVEKIPGGFLEESKVLNGIAIAKDIINPNMSRKIVNPRIILLDCPLEYKKGESQTNMEFQKDMDFEQALRMEEAYIFKLCEDIIKLKPTVVCTEKGVSDYAQHFLIKAGISVLRRLRKTDNNRIARAVGATIVNDPADLKEAHVGKECGLFEVRKIGDEYFSFFEQCKNPKACTVMLRGAGKDVLNEIERNLQDAMGVARALVVDPRIICGGGACEMAIGQALVKQAKTIQTSQQRPFEALAAAFEIIPRTLMENCGAKVIRVMTELRAKHAEGKSFSWGVNGTTGEITDMEELKIFEPISVKYQTVKTAIESSCMLLRIDDIVSGLANKEQ
uniref:T-complex protein 1 subunit gamma n=1 Tax=Lotharella oceanica TaxID=641309 RepID=A0A7S2U239_9EUKA